MDMYDGRTYLIIDKSAIRRNISAAAYKLGKDVKIMCLVKADAYGHGAISVAKCCADIVDYFGVATVGEGVQLRRSGIDLPILIVGDAPPRSFEDAVKYSLQLTVHSLQCAQSIDSFCKSRGASARVHIAIDSGMGRIGFLPGELSDIRQVFALKNLRVAGIFSHLSKADELDKSYSHMQIKQFTDVVSLLQKDGYDVGLRHIANSAAILDMTVGGCDMARMGIMTYGLYPSLCVDRSADLAPAMSWYARISHIKTLPKGMAVSYGGDFVTKRATAVATLSVGYGDGYPRALSNKGHVLVRGRKAQIIGRICMDQTMIDVTDIPGVNVGDVAVLIGSQGDLSVTAEDIASWADTINYEIVCGISRRVPRLYVE
ncbi:MAG: alanine racemase [Clostridia bacterium]|jgi:alanine racemase|nr:alanine racemase [Clostridia bacterium]